MTRVLAKRRDTNGVEAVAGLGRQAGALVASALQCGAMSPRKARRLESALRSAVNTDFGTRHEESAIRQYERLTGNAIVESNEHLLLWRFPRDETRQPANVKRVPLRPRTTRPAHDASTSVDTDTSYRLLIAIDRCRAALAVERAEMLWYWRLLRMVDASAELEDYCIGGDEPRWDAFGLMSDLRIARGRRLLATLQMESRMRQKAEGRLRWLHDALGEDAAAGSGGRSGRRTSSSSIPRASHYCHGGDLWDIDGLNDDLRIERRKMMAVMNELAALGEDVTPNASWRRGEEEADDTADMQCLFYLCGAVDGITDELVPPSDGANDEDGWSVRRVVVEIKQRVGSIKSPPPFYDEVQLATYCLMLNHEEGDLVQCLREEGGDGVSNILITRLSLTAEPTRHGANWKEHVLPRLYAFARAVHNLRVCRKSRYRYLLSRPQQRRRLLAEAMPHLSVVLGR